MNSDLQRYVDVLSEWSDEQILEAISQESERKLRGRVEDPVMAEAFRRVANTRGLPLVSGELIG